jgi:rubrerythrin
MSTLSRASVLGAAGALTLAAPILTGRLSLAAAKTDPNDVKLLSAALALELAEIKAYGDAIASGMLSPPVQATLQSFAADHAAHRDTLTAALAKAGASASSEFAPLESPVPHSEADVLANAYGLERQIAALYLGATAQYADRELTATAASILGVETAHVALLAEALRRWPAYPSGFVTA